MQGRRQYVRRCAIVPTLLWSTIEMANRCDSCSVTRVLISKCCCNSWQSKIVVTPSQEVCAISLVTTAVDFTIGIGLQQRGTHNIDDEITYLNNPGFVFHDSGGFEAGSNLELEAMRSFIERRAKGSTLHEQLHAIWYVTSLPCSILQLHKYSHRFCIPVDDDRPFQDAEMAFLEQKDQSGVLLPHSIWHIIN
jgi:hypothetical protein